jgi:hypothetical protein
VPPTIAQLKNPSTISAAVRDKLSAVDPDAPDPFRNPFRVHWFNDASRKVSPTCRLLSSCRAANWRKGAHRDAARKSFR